MSALLDAPPAPGAAVVVRVCGDQAAAAGVVATSAQLERGRLTVRYGDGVTAVRTGSWLRTAGDGRDPVDVVLRPGGTEVTVTWRDGRRGRFAVAGLRG